MCHASDTILCVYSLYSLTLASTDTQNISQVEIWATHPALFSLNDPLRNKIQKPTSFFRDLVCYLIIATKLRVLFRISRPKLLFSIAYLARRGMIRLNNDVASIRSHWINQCLSVLGHKHLFSKVENLLYFKPN